MYLLGTTPSNKGINPTSSLQNLWLLWGFGDFHKYLIIYFGHVKGIADLSSLIKDQTCSLLVEVLSLNHWTTRIVPPLNLKFCIFLMKNYFLREIINIMLNFIQFIVEVMR